MKSFYQYLMTYRNTLKKTEMSLFAENVFFDHSFPKTSTNYHEISEYLELNGEYILNMSLFDETWLLYLNHEQRAD